MKKKKVWLLAIILLAAVGTGLAFMMDKVSVSASSVALADQGWRANFSSALHSGAIRRGDLYLTDAEGERVDVEMTLHENGKTLEIPAISTGEYTLHVKESAIKEKFLKSLATNEISFVVQTEIDALSNEEELKAYFAKLLELQKNNERYGAFGSDSTGSTEESASVESADSAAGDHSTTNNQSAGVDEADIVKTDGSYLYSISESRVIISDIRDPENMAVAEEIEFEEEMYPQQLFLFEKTLIVLGSQFSVMPEDGALKGHESHMAMTSVYLYDISDPSEPALIRNFGAEGNLTGARLAEGILYFVTNVYPDIWTMEQQKDVPLRPRTYDSAASEEYAPLSYDKISILPGTMEGRYSVITAIDLDNPQSNEISTQGYLGGSEQLYMTKESLYLTAAAYMPLDENAVEGDMEMAIWIPQQANTNIFKFALDGTSVRFIASQEVTGSLLNQFSMDEYNGYLRAVTTEGFAWNEAAPSKNHLFILDADMTTVGSVEDLAEGERIYSARFIKDKAYMVTFKETDPLFVIDVSVPSSPEVLGELKIPGFSNYLHPLGEDHLIGFGADTKLEPVKDGEPRVVTGGMKISLFDVSDFNNPLEKDTEIIGGQGTYSALQYDHKALFTHEDKNLYGFPIALYEEAGEGMVDFKAEGAMIYTITAEGISQTADLLQEAEQQYEDWNTSVQRIVYAGDTLFAVANSEIRSYDLNNFEQISSLNYN